MFDRSNRAEGPLNVQITLTNGRELTGKLVVPPGRALAETLNSSSAIIEFEATNEKRTFIAKAALQSVEHMK